MKNLLFKYDHMWTLSFKPSSRFTFCWKVLFIWPYSSCGSEDCREDRTIVEQLRSVRIQTNRRIQRSSGGHRKEVSLFMMKNSNILSSNQVIEPISFLTNLSDDFWCFSYNKMICKDDTLYIFFRLICKAVQTDALGREVASRWLNGTFHLRILSSFLRTTSCNTFRFFQFVVSKLFKRLSNYFKDHKCK